MNHLGLRLFGVALIVGGCSGAAVLPVKGVDAGPAPDAVAVSVATDGASDVAVSQDADPAVFPDAADSDAPVTAGDGGMDATSVGSADDGAAADGDLSPSLADASAEVGACDMCDLVDIAITPLDPALISGQTIWLHATGVYRDGTMRDLSTAVTWSASDSTVAAVGSGPTLGGFLLALGPPATLSVVATLGTISATTHLSVATGDPTDLVMTPLFVIPDGISVSIEATILWSDLSAADATASGATWTSSDPAVAHPIATPNGERLAGILGTAGISAHWSTLSASASVTFAAPNLVQLAISPASLTIASGTAQRLVALGAFTDAATRDVSYDASWKSADETRAKVGPDGVVSALAEGSVDVTAQILSLTAKATLTVTRSTLTSVRVAAPEEQMVPRTTQRWTATGVFSDGTMQDLTSFVTWSSSNSHVISTAGDNTFLGVSIGMATISATYGGVTGAATASVRLMPISSISVTADPVAQTGLQLHATGHFLDGSTQDLTRDVRWQSSDKTLMFVNNNARHPGIVTALSSGTGTVTASFQGVSGSTSLTFPLPAP